MGVKDSKKEFYFYIAARIIFFLAPIYSATFAVRIWNTKPRDTISFIFYVIEGIGIIGALCSGLLCRAIAQCKPSDRLTFSEICFLYAISFFSRSRFAGKGSYKRFITATEKPEAAQSKWLIKFIAERKDTVLGKDYGFGEIKSIDDFRKKLPITDYDVYRSYAERAANGEPDIMAKGVPDYIVLTSGTTGNNKKFPMKNSNFWDFIVKAHFMGMESLGDRFPCRFNLRKQVACWVLPNVIKHEKSGIRMGALSGYFDIRMSPFATPYVAYKDLKDESVLMYLHAVFGLLHDDVEIFLINFASLARSFFATLETRWRDIVDDIRSGTLSSSLDITPETRQELQKKMWADPARAAALAKEFEKGFENILPRVFPQAGMIMMTASGTLQTPSLTVQRKYFPNVPVVSSQHVGSEGTYGVCINPGTIENTFYTMLPNQAFYEFIPLHHVPSSDPPTKQMHQLELNEQYELCMTTDRGIFRYRTGDIIKVVSYYNKTPQYEFIGRYGQLLNICGEKTSENTFNVALEDTISKLKDFALVDYTTAENRTLDSSKGSADSDRYYLLFIELEPRNPKVSSLTEEQKEMFDDDQQMHNEGYKDLRVQGRIQRMKVIVTRHDAFLELKRYILRNNPKTSCAQFKTPRVLRTVEQLEFMLGTAQEEMKPLKE